MSTSSASGSPDPAVRESSSDDASFDLSEEQKRQIRILVVDDDSTTLESCESILEEAGYRVEVHRKPKEAVRRLHSQSFQIVLVDQRMPEMDGFSVISEVRQHSSDSLVIMMTGYATTEASMQAIQSGAWDYLPKPFTATQLLVLIGRAAHRVMRMRSISGAGDTDGVLFDNHGVRILGNSPGMREAVKRALKVAGTDASVFVTGESGTGKELIARCIHLESRRSKKDFVAINCAALPRDLIESELFGHRRGAFTGAVREKPGLLEMADGGTFFLDELSEMPLELQPKLLRVLQDGVLRRVGSEKDDAVVDVRFVSATNREPEEALDQGKLRHDLYYRLRVVPIHLPPLRERPEDIPLLARHFIRYYWKRHGLGREGPPRLTPEATDALVSHSWPGNVRELQNLMEQVVVLTDSTEELTRESLSRILEPGPGEPPLDASGEPFVAGTTLDQPYSTAKQELIDRFERRYLSTIVARTGGNISEAARRAGIDRTTLYRLMDKHDLDKEQLTP